jgi:hypothetical protein
MPRRRDARIPEAVLDHLLAGAERRRFGWRRLHLPLQREGVRMLPMALCGPEWRRVSSLWLHGALRTGKRGYLVRGATRCPDLGRDGLGSLP